MDGSTARHFISCYARVLTRAWCDEGFLASLESDPAKVLAGAGLLLPRDARVSVIRLARSGPDISLQLSLWEDGAHSGRYVLHVPMVGGLTDRQLDDLVGGLAPVTEGCTCQWCGI